MLSEGSALSEGESTHAEGYNYRHFTPEHYEVEFPLPGPVAGERLPDATLETPDGEAVRLSDYRGEWVVLETGSLTCPMYARGVDVCADLRREYPDVKFLVLYVREAHPGERTGAHETLSQKRACARRVREEYGEVRPVLVDDLDGELHDRLGGFPNMLYVVNPEGRVVYRGYWADPDRLRTVLEHREELHSDEYVEPEMWNPLLGLRVLMKGGLRAVWDLLMAVPSLVRLHRRAARFGSRSDEAAGDP